MKRNTDREEVLQDYDQIRSNIVALNLTGVTSAVMGLHWFAYDVAHFIKGTGQNPYGSVRETIFNLGVPIFCFLTCALAKHLGRRQYSLIENQETQERR
jgi:hypothetical protein